MTYVRDDRKSGEASKQAKKEHAYEDFYSLAIGFRGAKVAKAGIRVGLEAGSLMLGRSGKMGKVGIAVASLALGAYSLNKALERRDSRKNAGSKNSIVTAKSAYEKGYEEGYKQAERDEQLEDSYSAMPVKMPDLSGDKGSIKGMGLNIVENPFLVEHPVQGIVPTPGSMSGQKYYKADTGSYLGSKGSRQAGGKGGGIWGKGKTKYEAVIPGEGPG